MVFLVGRRQRTLVCAGQPLPGSRNHAGPIPLQQLWYSAAGKPPPRSWNRVGAAPSLRAATCRTKAENICFNQYITACRTKVATFWVQRAPTSSRNFEFVFVCIYFQGVHRPPIDWALLCGVYAKSATACGGRHTALFVTLLELARRGGPAMIVNTGLFDLSQMFRSLRRVTTSLLEEGVYPTSTGACLVLQDCVVQLSVYTHWASHDS